MTVQRRPLTGMVSSGVAAPRAISNVAPTVLHQVDSLATQQGGPYIDDVTLRVENTTGAPIVATITVLGGTAIAQSIPANSVVTLLDQDPFQAAAASTGTGLQILGQGASAGLVFWGWFARSL